MAERTAGGRPSKGGSKRFDDLGAEAASVARAVPERRAARRLAARSGRQGWLEREPDRRRRQPGMRRGRDGVSRGVGSAQRARTGLEKRPEVASDRWPALQRGAGGRLD